MPRSALPSSSPHSSRARRAAASLVGATLAYAVVVVTGCASAPPKGPPGATAELGASAKRWAAVVPPNEFVEFFKGTFHRLGVTVTDTGEQFTVVHTGNGFAFEPGQAQVDWTVPLQTENIARLVDRTADGELDDGDAYAIMAVMFTPVTKQILQHPATKNDALRRLSGVEDVIHVILLDPAGKDGVSHTLSYKGDAWEVTPGLTGTPQRVFRVTAVQAREYQARAFAAAQVDDINAWTAFASWYKEWREGVSKKTG